MDAQVISWPWRIKLPRTVSIANYLSYTWWEVEYNQIEPLSTEQYNFPWRQDLLDYIRISQV